MKKYISYIGILATGLLLGWFFFGSSSKTETEQNHTEETLTNQMWTCSMHPQIMQPEEGDCPICGMDLIPAETSAEGLNSNEFKLTENAMELANIQTSVIGESQIGDTTIKLSGKIEENEETNVIQASYFSGRIESLNINSTGEDIHKGQLLATIYSPELFAVQQELLTAYKLKEYQPELYNAVRNKFKLWKISDEQINQIEESGQVVQNFPIYATVSGTVSEKLVEQGDYVQQGQTLLKLTNLNSVWAQFDVYENQIELFKEGQAITVISNAYPNKELKQKVDFIDPTLNPKTRTSKLRVVLINGNRKLKTGMFVEGYINNSNSIDSQLITIPSTSILWTGKRSVVYIKTNSNESVFEMKEITLGKQLGEFYEVVEGLKNGDEIVTNGIFTVDAAAQLQGKKSMMNKSEGRTSTGHEGHRMKDKKMTMNSSIQKSFYPVIDAYIELKDALIQSDISLASDKSDSFRIALDAIPFSERKETNNHWSILHKTSKGINRSADIVQQRKLFQVISKNLIEFVENFEKVNSKLFVQFCPMAGNNNGAHWLSKDEKVLNPYFGEDMLNCGSVVRVIE